MKTLLAAAVLAAGLAPFAAQAQSSSWTTSGGGRGGPSAESCISRGGQNACLRVACRQGRLQLELSGLRQGPNQGQANRPGDVKIDGRERNLNWSQGGGQGGQTWVAGGRTRGLFEAMQAGNRMSVELGPRERPLEFSLRGSSAAIGDVQRGCRR